MVLSTSYIPEGAGSRHTVNLSLKQIVGPHINPLKSSGLYGTGFNIKKLFCARAVSSCVV